MSLVAGTRLGPYEIQSAIGAGGMGEVYKARDTRLDRTVAIKILPADLTADSDRRARFEREAKTIAALNHPNICTLYDIGEDEGGTPFLVMELLHGQSLRAAIGRHGLATTPLLELAIQIADALDTAHRAGIVHRDIKPANVFVTGKGAAKLLDFGLARQEAREPGDSEATRAVTASLTAAGTVAGTVAYMSPEQALGQAVDARSDLFSFGALLYEMATGCQAFAGDSAVEVVDAVLHQAPQQPVRLNHALPPEFEQIVGKALEKDREVRYQSAAEIHADLERLRRQLSSGMASNATFARRPKRRRWPFVAASAALVVAVAAGAGWWYSSRPSILAERDPVVVADIVNETGDRQVDALKVALAVGLGQSPYVKILSDTRVAGALGLMRKPANERLTPEVAREVCRRLNAKAVLVASVRPIASRFSVGLDAVACTTGDFLVRDTEDADHKDKLTVALGTLVRRMRGHLGESLASIRRSDRPLEQVTTTSLAAAEQFTLALEKADTNDRKAAIGLYNRAIELDSDFAMAHARLASLHGNVGTGQMALAIEHAKKAYALRDRLTESERAVVALDYHRIVDHDLNVAIELGRQVLTSSMIGVSQRNNYAFALVQIGELDRALTEWRQVLEESPDNRLSATNLTRALILSGRLGEARAVAEKAQVPGYPYYIAFLEGDEAAMASASENGTRWFATQAFVQFLRGRVREAEALYARATPGGRLFSLQYLLAGNQTAARETARRSFATQSSAADVDPEVALVCGLVGDVDYAEKTIRGINERFPKGTLEQYLYIPLIQAGIELGRGNPQQAIEVLQASLPYEPYGGYYGSVRANIFWRGRAYYEAKWPREAAAEFEKVAAIPHYAVYYRWAHLWLARSWALAGETAKARDVYDRLFVMWKDAEPDFKPLLEARAEYANLGR